MLALAAERAIQGISGITTGGLAHGYSAFSDQGANLVPIRRCRDALRLLQLTPQEFIFATGQGETSNKI
jgi:hypothetical protein